MSRLVPAADVAWCEDARSDGAQVALGRVPDGEPILLREVSALIWLLLLDLGTPEAVAATLAEEFVDVDAGEIAASVQAFTADLVTRGLLVAAPHNERSPDSTSETR